MTRSRGIRPQDKKLAPEPPDLTRCHAYDWRGSKERCALDVGHYHGRDTTRPSPHVSENGIEWF